jgi:hypothetical protein
MRNLAILPFIVFATACGGDDPVKIIDAAIDSPMVQEDAPVDSPPPPDFSCMGNAAPADGTAIDPLVLSGTAFDFNAIQMMPVAVAAALVNSFDGTNVTPTATDTTDAGGLWDLSIASGTNPVNGFIEATKTGFRTIRLYPPSPMIASQMDIPLIMLSNGNFQLAQAAASITQDPAKGTVGLIVADCANAPIDGAVASVTQGGVAVGEPFDLSFVQPGLVVYFNVPVGVTTVGATFNGMTLRSHDVDSVATVTSTTGVRPGF